MEEFIVFAIESPTLSSRVHAGGAISSCSKADYRFSKNDLVISSGYIETDCNAGEHTRIMPAGLLQMGNQQFSENIVAQLVKPDSYVIIVYSGKRSGRQKLLEAALNIGFQIIESQDDLVCLGKGSLIHDMHWLTGAWPAGVTSLISLKKCSSILERTIIDGGQSGIDVIKMLDHFWIRVHAEPEVVSNELSNYELIATLEGVEYSDVFISLSEIDVVDTRSLCRQTADKMGIMLYDAGTISDLESSGYFKGTDQWRLLPDGWKRIV
ncbi:hypothetical protein [uncultured Desulfobulbus sp.]|uniref:hypothetical protein n=1 Tax=uncultured Desulfobulbus sp. TaxID=239745 RepID=UPI0029C8012D|nr:hypothetical protein [uncultured Desulfobulbus sp.]